MAATIDVNVANQAYPPPPPDSQGLPVPSAVEVEAFPFVQPSLSLGTAQVQAPTVNIQNFSAVLSPATTQDVIVTENGNFATNNQNADVQTFTVVAVVTQGTAPTQVFQITLNQGGVAVVLSRFGVDFTQLFASFPAAAVFPENVPSRQISAFNDPNTIVVPAVDSFGNTLTTPSPGDSVTVGIVRQGASLTVNSNVKEIDVFVAPAPPAAVTAPAIGNLSLGNVSPSLIGLPFIGSGVGAPPFLGTFEVENQVPLGKGLPANVFV